MEKNIKVSKKLRFEKPEILEAEFVVCGMGLLVAKVPAAIAISAVCNVPGVLAALPTAALY